MNAIKRPAYALATILILLGVSLFGVGAIVSVSGLESKISRSQQEGTKAYYAAEAGIEDALWQLHNTPTYTQALADGTLNITYHSRTKNGDLFIDNSANDVPTLGQGFTVTLTSTAPHYAIVSAHGFSDNQSFRARREVKTTVFLGEAEAPDGSNAIMSGGSMSVNGGTVNITGGDWYSSGSISLNGAHINAGENKIKTTSSYAAHGGDVDSGGVESSNHPPATAAATVPGFDFHYYSTHYDKKYSNSGIASLMSGSQKEIDLSGPVTYISNALSLNGGGKTLNITGMLVIDGSFSINGSTKINVIDPGNGKSGIFVAGAVSLNGSKDWNIDGLLYSSGAMAFNGSNNIIIDGGLFVAGAVSVNGGQDLTIAFNPSRTSGALNIGTAWAVGVEHWEEEY